MKPESPFDLLPEDPSETTRRPTSPFAHDPEPRLGIVHLMGWTGVTAVFLGLQRILMPGMPDSPAFAVIRIAAGLGAGISLGSLLMTAVRRWRRIPFPVHPGEFLLVLHGCTMLVTLAACGALVFITNGTIDSLWKIAIVIWCPQFVVLTFFAIWAWQKLRQRHWREFFVSFAVLTVLLLAVQFALPPLYWFPAWIRSAIRLAMAGLLANAVLGDMRAGERRPWTHWLGIALQVWLWFTEWFLPMLVPLR